VDAAPLSATNIRTLDNCINRALYKIFSGCDGEGMAVLRQCLGFQSSNIN